MATKKQLFQRMWKDIKVHLPPDSDEEILLGFAGGESRVAKASLVVMQQRQMRDPDFGKKTQTDPAMKLTGYMAIKWMTIYN